MPRLQISPTVPFMAIFLILCIIGLSNSNNKPLPSHTRFADRADIPLLSQRNNNKKGLKYLRSPTGTAAAAPIPTQTCYNPPLSVPASQVNVDALCQCASYPQWDENPNPYYNAGEFGNGKAYCETTCVPKYANQTKSVTGAATESFSQCMFACDGSFDKKRKSKRITSDEYWFCHGVNFIKGELCQFIGEIAYPDYGSSPGVECYDNGLTPKVLVSDDNAMMVAAAKESLVSTPLPHVDCKVLDLQDLSIFTFIRPVDAVRETYRTLEPGGLAVVTCGRRFAPMFSVHNAQKKIRPDLALMPTPSPEFYEEGVLQKKVEEAGFSKEKITMDEKVLTVKDAEDVVELEAPMSGSMMARAREGNTTEEQSRWVDCVIKSVEEEIEQFGGIRFEAYILLATK
ncbi:hypothetical protein N0V82_007201 [Gnomoniopsis sp. IMI 355080]|nr:hypothetical protein N0V82_007201 [Gnomoniopsis sp. IMI 355080]